MAKKKKIIFTVFLVCLFSIFLVELPSQKVLAITNRKNTSEKYFSKSGYKNGFIISYTHSVNKGRVHDFYTCMPDGKLLLDKTIFVSYGAGIPEPEETPGAVFTVTDDGYSITNLQRYVSKLTMAVGLIANHSIVTEKDFSFSADNKSELFLTDFFKPQTSITLEIRRVSLINYIFHKL